MNRHLYRNPVLRDGTGAIYYYDRQHSLVARWLDRFLNKHNMAWVQGNAGFAKIVRLDGSRQLPLNWSAICDEAWAKSFDIYDRFRAEGRIKREFWGGVIFSVNTET